ncbi:MAG: branched-chain amino acid ABC transporter permease [Anaerolineaceae bacterium]|nr:branched-chain amino acid ABC transporter permease [Anaerolineaceae bacterium]
MTLDHLTTAEIRQQRRVAVSEKKGGSKKELAMIGVLLLVLFLYPLLPIVTGTNYNYSLHLLLFTYLYIAMASSWNILGGYTGYISLGHNVFFAVGGYVSGMLLLNFGLSPFITWPLAGLTALLVGFGFGFITLRIRRGPAFIISTIALLMLVRILFDNWELIGGSNGISLPLLEMPVQLVKIPFYYALLILAVVTVYCSYWIKQSKFGLGLRAISQDEIKAESAGIPTSFYKILAFAISGLFVGVAGAFWGQYLTYMRPNIYLVILIAANLVLMSILGGRGTVAGPVLGAIILIIINEFFVSQFGGSELNIVGTGVIMLVVLLFFPMGIVGSLRKAGKLPKILDWD